MASTRKTKTRRRPKAAARVSVRSVAAAAPVRVDRSRLTAEQCIRADLLEEAQKKTRDELAILRRTRGQREVGEVKVPPSLRHPETVVLSNKVDPRLCRGCGRPLASVELDPAWRNEWGNACHDCVRNPNSEVGVEHRADRSPNVRGV